MGDGRELEIGGLGNYFGVDRNRKGRDDTIEFLSYDQAKQNLNEPDAERSRLLDNKRVARKHSNIAHDQYVVLDWGLCIVSPKKK